MIVQKKSIRNIEKYILHIKEGGEFYIGVRSLGQFYDKLSKIGFNLPLNVGETVLPSPVFGSISRFNSEGKELIRKDLPKEKHYTSIETPNWGDPYYGYHTVEMPYEKYPRDFIKPPSIELTVNKDSSDQFILVSPKFRNKKGSYNEVLHIANLFLEIFGEFQFFNTDLDNLTKTPLIRLNWKVLPQGKYPWNKMKKELSPIVSKAKKTDKTIINKRLERINNSGADFTAIGTAGFQGYVIFGFKDKNVYVLESIYYGNATYVFEENWEELAKKTKAEILNEDSHKDRIIHQEGWESRIDKLLKAKE